MPEKTISSRRLRELYADIRPDLDRIETRLAEMTRSDNPLIGEINAYLFAEGGKRLRPALLTLCARLNGGGDDAGVGFWSALIEIIHTASLIHDDIIDRTDRRRGRETVHARWGENITVLLGDHLYIRAIRQALRTRRYEIIDELSAASERMIEGEILECSVSGDAGLNEDRYIEILDKKTAALFAAACRIGGMIGGAEPDLIRRLGEYGRNLGLAFQIVDDLLDFTGRPSALGKPVLTDLHEGRITLPVICALRKSEGSARTDFLTGIASRVSDPDAVGRIRDAVLASGAIPEVAARAGEYAARAKSFLPPGPAEGTVKTLALLADFVLERSV
ncbi:MAG: polyprenyl synthetase family protein [Candidatus Aminicenantales bacterium]